jgi:hypothetical protein
MARIIEGDAAFRGFYAVDASVLKTAAFDRSATPSQLQEGNLLPM